MVACFGLILAVAARAQVTFTITGTANANTAAYGYNVGQAYTFVFTIPGNYSSPNSAFTANSSHIYADEDTTLDTNLFTSISGSGLAGTFVRPTDATTAPYSQVGTSNVTELQIYVGSDTGSHIGLATLNVTSLEHIRVTTLNGPNFAFPGTYETPASYFQTYVGSYTTSTGGIYLGDSVNNEPASFVMTNLTIAVTPVPEPATDAVWAGLIGLGVVQVVRRRRKAA